MTSYRFSIVTMALSHVVSDLFYVEKYPSQEPIKVIESGTIRWTGYSFLLVFYSNFVPEIFDFKNVVTVKTGLGVRQGHWKFHYSIEGMTSY